MAISTVDATAPSATESAIWPPPRRRFASIVTPVPATTLLMNAIMVAEVVKNAASAPDQSGGAHFTSGQRPL